MRKKVGRVTEIEKDEIQLLFERKSGLNELAKILTSDNEFLYEKMVKDFACTNSLFQDWWNRMSMKYNWESAENGLWEIDFDTCEVFLRTND